MLCCCVFDVTLTHCNSQYRFILKLCHGDLFSLFVFSRSTAVAGEAECKESEVVRDWNPTSTEKNWTKEKQELVMKEPKATSVKPSSPSGETVNSSDTHCLWVRQVYFTLPDKVVTILGEEITLPSISKEVRKCTVACFLSSEKGQFYFATTAHDSAVDAKYFSGNPNKGGVYLGKCVYHILEENPAHNYDLALVKLDGKVEMNMKSTWQRGGCYIQPKRPDSDDFDLRERVPADKTEEVCIDGPGGSKQGVLFMAERRMELTGRGLVHCPQPVVESDDWPDLVCVPGDSGSLITSLPCSKCKSCEERSSNIKCADALAMAGSWLNLDSDKNPNRPVCLIAPIWEALKKFEKEKHVRLDIVDPNLVVSDVLNTVAPD